MRKYKSGTKWCIWRWTEIKSQKNKPYLKRLHLLKTPFFSIYLHWIYQHDFHHTKQGLPVLHNHPVDFLSIILYGAYCEITDITWKYTPENCFPNYKFNNIYFFNWISHNKKHHIYALSPKPVVTLCFAGPSRHKWGYFLMNYKTHKYDYIPWDEYNV